ncbi:MAG: fibronectin type III domain-containing protein [Candidatus Diapherotrites archaeon]|nr:fibronectin type III domain-containing protein [Candidatus Diapherotrites archaeon]
MAGKKIFIGIVLLLVLPLVAASVIIQWQAPTQNTDGSQISGPLSYNIYRSKPSVGSSPIGSTVETSYADTATTSGTEYCYQITALSGGVESDKSSEGCALDSGTVKFCSSDADCLAGKLCKNNVCTDAVCGNGVKEIGEECDKTDFGTQTCTGFGFDGGTLKCSASCKLDKSGCANYVCGNNKLEPGEECEGSNLNGKTCASLGFSGGTLACNASCTFNASGCADPPKPPTDVGTVFPPRSG